MPENHTRADAVTAGDWSDFEALYSSCPFPSCILDRKGLIRRVNAAAEAFLGYSQDELVGHRLTTFIAPVDRHRATTAISQAEIADIGVAVLRVEWSRRFERYTEWTFRRIPGSNLIVTWATDVTEARAVEDELRARVERLRVLLAERTRDLAETQTRAENARIAREGSVLPQRLRGTEARSH